LGLGQLLDTHRILYNEARDQRIWAWAMERKSVTYCQQSAWFKGFRPERQCFASLNFSSAQATLRRLDKAFKSFFRRIRAGQKAGFPRFKHEDRWHSVLFPANGNGIRLKGNRLRVQGFDRQVRVRKHREAEGRVKTISVKREAGRWFVVLACDLGSRDFVPNGKPSVGIDMGLTHFLTDSDGDRVENPRFLKETLPELRRANRSLARKKKGSKKRVKAKGKLRRVHAKVSNQRRDFVHKASRDLVSKFGLVGAEDLRIGNMVRNRRLSRSISDAGWGMFLEAARYKAEEAGCVFVSVDPRGTSQDCSGCGRKVPKGLSVRWHECPHCGLSLDRDHNAARNILFRALARTGPTNGETNLGLLHGGSSRSLLPRGRSGSPRL